MRSLHRSGSTGCSSALMPGRLSRTYSSEAAEAHLHLPRPGSSNRPQSCAVLHLASRVLTCALLPCGNVKSTGSAAVYVSPDPAALMRLADSVLVGATTSGMSPTTTTCPKPTGPCSNPANRQLTHRKRCPHSGSHGIVKPAEPQAKHDSTHTTSRGATPTPRHRLPAASASARWLQGAMSPISKPQAQSVSREVQIRTSNVLNSTHLDAVDAAQLEPQSDHYSPPCASG